MAISAEVPEDLWLIVLSLLSSGGQVPPFHRILGYGSEGRTKGFFGGKIGLQDASFLLQERTFCASFGHSEKAFKGSGNDESKVLFKNSFIDSLFNQLKLR